jgi:hypothetical protein
MRVWLSTSSVTRMMSLPFASTPAEIPIVDGKLSGHTDETEPSPAFSTCTRLLPRSATYSLPFR